MSQKGAHEEMSNSVVVRGTNGRAFCAGCEARCGLAISTENGAANAGSPIESAPQTVAVVDAVCAISLLERVAHCDVGSLEIKRVPREGALSYQFGHVRLDLPNGPIVYVPGPCCGIVDVFPCCYPIRAGLALVEVEIHVELGRNVIGVGDRPLKAGDVFRIDRPGQSFCGFVEFVRRCQPRRREVTQVDGPEIRSQSNWT